MVAVAAEPTTGAHFRLYETQDDFFWDDRRYVAFIGGRNSGKTYVGSLKALARAGHGGLGIIAAPDFPMLRFGAYKQFKARLDESGLTYTENKSNGTLFIPRFNAEILFATLETESRVRGPNADWGWADEVEYVADRNVWKAFKGAVRVGEHPQLFVTSTPKGRRLVWEEWIINGGDQHQLYKASTFDNPFIDASDYVGGLGYSGQFYAQEITAEFVTFEGLVYPGFNRATCVRQQDCDGWRTVLGVDIGTRNPTAIITVRIAGDERQHIEREVYRAGMSSSEVVEAVKTEADRCNPEAIYIDPSAANYILDLRRDGYPVEKADNDRKRGIQLCTSVVNHPNGFSVDPSCVNFIDELETYRYPDGRQGDDPLKEHDHAMDGWRYGTVGVAEPSVEVDFF